LIDLSPVDQYLIIHTTNFYPPTHHNHYPQVFEGLRQASVGDLSTRYANAVRRKLLDSIRHDLSEKYRSKGEWISLGGYFVYVAWGDFTCCASIRLVYTLSFAQGLLSFLCLP